MYFCGGTLSGPFFEYKDFDNFIHLNSHYKNIPSTIVPTLKRISAALGKNYLFINNYSISGACCCFG
jgi:hypothetical protein